VGNKEGASLIYMNLLLRSLTVNQDRVLGQGENASILMHRVFDVDDEMAAHETLYFSDQKVYPH
jgi:hypothetical protein